MTYSSRTDAINTDWANVGDDDDQPTQRRSGMDREVENYDPAALVAGLPPRDGSAGMPASGSNFDDIGERPPWHSAATPEPVAAAWAAVLAAVDAAVDADQLERALDGEEAQAQRTEAARVRSAVAAGRTVKASAGRDWAAERRHLAAISAGHRDLARQRRVEYDDLVAQHQAAWGASLIEQLPSAKEQTLKALAMAGHLAERLLDDATAAQTLALEPGGSVVPLPVLPVRRFMEAMEAVASEIQASPQLAGEGLVRPPMTPSWSARQQIAAGIMHGQLDSGAFWLAEVERRERFQLTSFTRGIPLGDKPSEVTQW